MADMTTTDITGAKKSEFLLNFLDKYAEPLHQETIAVLEDDLTTSYNEITGGLIFAYDKLFRAIETAQLNGKGDISYINFYMLRTNMKLGNDNCLICAYDKDWYLDKEPVRLMYSVPYLFQPFYGYMEKVRQERKRYSQNISYGTIELLQHSKWNEYISYMPLLLKSIIDRIVSLNSYGFQKCDMFIMGVGEYMDFSDLLWLADNNVKNAEIVREFFQSKPEKGLCSLHISHMDLSDGNYGGNDFRSSRFENVDFYNSLLDYCIMVDAKFNDCNLHSAVLRYSHIWCGDFSGSNLANVDLSYANAKSEPDYTKLGRPYFPKIRFCNANLDGANLSFGDFSFADFTGASLSDCNLAGAKLMGATMDTAWKENLGLTDEQKGLIKWI